MSVDRGFTSGFGGTFGVVVALVVVFLVIPGIMLMLVCGGCLAVGVGGASVLDEAADKAVRQMEEEERQLQQQRDAESDADATSGGEGSADEQGSESSAGDAAAAQPIDLETAKENARRMIEAEREARDAERKRIADEERQRVREAIERANRDGNGPGLPKSSGDN